MKQVHFEAHLTQFVKLPETVTDDLLKLRYNYCFLGSHKWCSSTKIAIEWVLHDLLLRNPQSSVLTLVLSSQWWQLLSLFPYFAEIKERFESVIASSRLWGLTPAFITVLHCSHWFFTYVFNSTRESKLLLATGFYSCSCSWMLLLSFQGLWQESSISRNLKRDTSLQQLLKLF